MFFKEQKKVSHHPLRKAEKRCDTNFILTFNLQKDLLFWSNLLLFHFNLVVIV